MADFGLCRIIGEANSVDIFSEYRARDTAQWMAPELLDAERYGYIKGAPRKLPSKSTDIYALGMTIFEARMSSPLLPYHLTLFSSVGGDGSGTL